MIAWHTEQRKLSDLVEWDKNPRQLSDHDKEHIEISLDKFGLADPLVINLDGQLIGGHQRKKIMLAMEQYGTNVEIDVRVPDRQLTEAEAAELNIRLNKNTGEWNFDVLGAEFKLDDLKEWGFSELELSTNIFNPDNVEFPEYDESIADEVEYIECPDCGAKWPK